MLAELLKYIYEAYDVSWLRVVTYITFRLIAGGLTSLFLCILFGKKLIDYLKLRVIEPIKEEAPDSHKEKQGIPTMGGFMIIIPTLVSILLWADLKREVVWLLILSIVWMSTTGFIDDYLKVIKKIKTGIKEHQKLASQILLGVVIGGYTLLDKDLSVLLSQTTIPGFKNWVVDYGFWYLPVSIFIITATSNAANLTDGLDGLAAGCSAISLLVLAVFAYLTGNVIYSNYLNIVYIQGGGEIAIVAFILASACFGFLWFNAYPAQVFMGDTGSLALGSAIAVIALLIKKELMLPVIAGVFLIEATSVLIQRIYFKFTKRKYGRGRRFFKMAPLHHHFQLKGWSEPKIIVRFWIVAMIFALGSLISLKLR